MAENNQKLLESMNSDSKFFKLDKKHLELINIKDELRFQVNSNVVRLEKESMFDFIHWPEQCKQNKALDTFHFAMLVFVLFHGLLKLSLLYHG